MSSTEIRDVRHERLHAYIFSDDAFHKALDLLAIKSHHWKILPCSAVTGENLIEGLDWVVDDVAGRLYYSTVVEEVAPQHGAESLRVH